LLFSGLLLVGAVFGGLLRLRQALLGLLEAALDVVVVGALIEGLPVAGGSLLEIAFAKAHVAPAAVQLVLLLPLALLFLSLGNLVEAARGGRVAGIDVKSELVLIFGRFQLAGFDERVGAATVAAILLLLLRFADARFDLLELVLHVGIVRLVPERLVKLAPRFLVIFIGKRLVAAVAVALEEKLLLFLKRRFSVFLLPAFLFSNIERVAHALHARQGRRIVRATAERGDVRLPGLLEKQAGRLPELVLAVGQALRTGHQRIPARHRTPVVFFLYRLLKLFDHEQPLADAPFPGSVLDIEILGFAVTPSRGPIRRRLEQRVPLRHQALVPRTGAALGVARASPQQTAEQKPCDHQ
jgi:hypothetical protein